MCKHIDTVKSLYESDEHQWMLEQIKHLEEKTFDKLDQPSGYCLSFKLRHLFGEQVISYHMHHNQNSYCYIKFFFPPKR
jgi:hypothetical protein